MMIGVKKFYIVFAMTLFYMVEIQGSPLERDNGFILSGITDLTDRTCTSHNDCSFLPGHMCCWFPYHGKVCSDTYVDDFYCFENVSEGARSAVSFTTFISNLFGHK